MSSLRQVLNVAFASDLKVCYKCRRCVYLPTLYVSFKCRRYVKQMFHLTRCDIQRSVILQSEWGEPVPLVQSRKIFISWETVNMQKK